MGVVVRTSSRSDRRAASGEEGFTLLSVLLVTAVVSAAALAGALLVRAGAAGARGEAEAIRARTLAQAGLVRVTAALEDGDPLKDRLLAADRPVEWRMGEDTIALTLTREAGRLDLNRGRGDLVAAVLQGTAGDPDIARRLVERLASKRRAGEELEHVTALLDPAERLDPARARWTEVFTVSTAAEGLELAAASPQTLRVLQGLSAEGESASNLAAVDPALLASLHSRLGAIGTGERPLYRVRIQPQVAPGISVTALLARNVSTGMVTTFGIGGWPR